MDRLLLSSPYKRRDIKKHRGVGVKYNKVKKALKGLNVEWNNHFSNDTGTPDMARVNGYSIVWHKYSYGHEHADEVEIMDNGDCYRILISELRRKVV